MESTSESVLAWIESSGERLIVSEWGITEFSSAAAIKVRTRQIRSVAAKQAKERFLSFAQEHCAMAVPTMFGAKRKYTKAAC
jgi:hypothetical protein